MNIDSISNLISIIKNGYQAEKLKVDIPFSNEKEKILEVLKKEKYIKNLKVTEKDGRKNLRVKLLYKNKMPTVNKIERISKPGQRIYSKPKKFRPVLSYAKSGQDMGIVIISTSSGIMTTKEAKKKNIGGELLLKVY